MKSQSEVIYLDYAASAPLRPEVIELLQKEAKDFANPSSIHKDGMKARDILEVTRKKIASTLGASADEIIFTASVTESLNIATQGTLKAAKENFARPHVITSKIEHPSILNTLRAVEKGGVEVTYLTPDFSGQIDLQDLKDALRPETVLLAFALVNSEIGNIFPIKEVSQVIKKYRRDNSSSYPYLLLDVAQAPLFLQMRVDQLGADLMAFGGAKFGALPGSGSLFIRKGTQIEPVIFGGGQERGLRPGTPNVLAIESLGLALELAQEEAEDQAVRLYDLKSRFIALLREKVANVKINGDEENSAPHIVSACFSGVDAEWLVLSLDARGIRVSRGSACKSGKGNESEALLVFDPECAGSTVRFSFGASTTKEGIVRTVEALQNIYSLMG